VTSGDQRRSISDPLVDPGGRTAARVVELAARIARADLPDDIHFSRNGARGHARLDDEQLAAVEHEHPAPLATPSATAIQVRLPAPAAMTAMAMLVATKMPRAV